MSDALDVAYVEIEPDFSTFNRSVESGVRDAARELDRTLTGTLNDLEGEFEGFADDALTAVQDALDRIADAGEDSADEIDAAYTDLEAAIRDAFDGASRSADAAFDDIRRDADLAFSDIEVAADRAADEMEQSFRQASDEVDTSLSEGTESSRGGFLDLANSAFEAGTDIRGAMAGAAGAAGIGAIVVAVGAAIDAFFEMGQEALDLEGDIIRLTQSTDAGFSTASVDSYRDALLGLQSEYGILTDDLIPALNTAIVQGVPEDNVISFLETAAQSAVVSGQDLNDTVSVINGLMAQFEGEFADAGAAADFLTATLGNTNAEVADIGDVFGEISGFARDAGVDVNQVSAAFAAMSVTGRDAGTSGGQLAALIEELGDATTPVAMAFDDLTGRSFQQFIAEGGNLQQAAQIIADGAASAGQSVVELAGSAESSSAILALSTEAGAARYAEALADVDAANGTTEESFGQLEDSGALAFSQLEGSLATLRDEAGAAVAPLVAQFVEGLIPILEELSPILQGVGEILMTAFSVAMEFLSPLIDLVVGLFEAISPLLEALSPLWEILSLIGEIIGGILVPVFDVLFAILGPIFELIGLLLTPALELIRLAFEGIAYVIETWVTPAIEWLAGQLGEWLAPAVEWLTEKVNLSKLAFQIMINWVRDHWDDITSTIGDSVGAIGNFFEAIYAVAKGTINGIIRAWNAIDFSFSVSIPDWVPEIGGSSFSISDVVPDIPLLQTGGFTTAEGLAMLHPDEMVLPLTNSNGINALAAAIQEAGGTGGDGQIQVVVQIGNETITQMVDTQVNRNNKTLTRRARAGTGRV
jgi:TP901 family phage tail tape measure protein